MYISLGGDQISPLSTRLQREKDSGGDMPLSSDQEEGHQGNLSQRRSFLPYVHVKARMRTINPLLRRRVIPGCVENKNAPFADLGIQEYDDNSEIWGKADKGKAPRDERAGEGSVGLPARRSE